MPIEKFDRVTGAALEDMEGLEKGDDKRKVLKKVGVAGDNILKREQVAREPNWEDGLNTEAYWRLTGTRADTGATIITVALQPKTVPDVRRLVKSTELSLSKFLKSPPRSDMLRNI